MCLLSSLQIFHSFWKTGDFFHCVLVSEGNLWSIIRQMFYIYPRTCTRVILVNPKTIAHGWQCPVKHYFQIISKVRWASIPKCTLVSFIGIWTCSIDIINYTFILSLFILLHFHFSCLLLLKWTFVSSKLILLYKEVYQYMFKV